MSLEIEVKSKILVIAGKPDEPGLLHDGTTLNTLGYTGLMLIKLRTELQKIAVNHNTGKIVPPLTVDETAKDCITLTA